MGISKQMMFEKMEQDRIDDDISLLESLHNFDDEGYWEHRHTTDFTVCVECGDSVLPKTLCYLHTTAGVACHVACVEDRMAYDHAMGKDD